MQIKNKMEVFQQLKDLITSFLAYLLAVAIVEFIKRRRKQ